MRKCPYCAEEIKEQAVLCRYCGRRVKPDLFRIAVILIIAGSLGWFAMVHGREAARRTKVFFAEVRNAWIALGDFIKYFPAGVKSIAEYNDRVEKIGNMKFGEITDTGDSGPQ